MGLKGDKYFCLLFFPFSWSGELPSYLPSLLNEQKQILALLSVLEFSVLLFQKKSQAPCFNTFKNWDRKDSAEKFGQMKELTNTCSLKNFRY